MNREMILKHTTPFEAHLQRMLADPKEAQGYLRAVADAYTEDNNTDVLLLAVRDVVRADFKTYTLSPLSSSEEIAKSTRQEILHLILNFTEGAKTESPVAPLGKILGRLQDVINTIGMICVKANKLTEEIKRKMEIRFLTVGAGSFDIRLASTATVDLLDYSDFGNAIEEFLNLLKAGSDSRQLKTLLEQLRPRVAREYIAFLQSLSGTVIDSKFKWVSPNSERGGDASLSSNQIRDVIRILKKFQQENPTTLTVIGTLTGVLLSTKRFEIQTEDGPYAGKIADQAFETVSHATLSQIYKAEILELTEKSETTDETKTKYELLSLANIQ